MCQRNRRISNVQTQGQRGSDKQSLPHEFGCGVTTLLKTPKQKKQVSAFINPLVTPEKPVTISRMRFLNFEVKRNSADAAVPKSINS